MPRHIIKQFPALNRRIREQSRARTSSTASSPYRCNLCGVSPKGGHECLFYNLPILPLLRLTEICDPDTEDLIWNAIENHGYRATLAHGKGRRKKKKRDAAEPAQSREPPTPLNIDSSSQASPPSIHNMGITDPLELSKSLQSTIENVVSEKTEESDWFAHAIEAICIGAYGMYYAESTETFVTHFVQTAHSIYGKSLSYTIWELLTGAGITVEHNDQPGEDPTWVLAIRSMLDDWESFRQSPLLSVGLKIMGIFVSLGYCSLENLDFKLGNFQLFSKIVVPEKVTLVDMISCGASIMHLVVHQGYECFKYGSYTPLLYHEDQMLPILKKVAECEKIHAYFELGNLRSMSIDEVAFASLLKETKDELYTLARVARSPVSKKLLMDKYARIELIDAALQTRMTTGGLKVAPFTVGIWGGSSVGKTTVNNILVPTLLRALQSSYKDRDRIKLNPMESFASGAHNGITAITFDEMGQQKEKFIGSNPAQMTFMQLGNNEATPLNMAEAHLKGKIAPRPVVMTTTKNVKDNAARSVLNEPIACVRREHYILTVVVRDQFATNGFLNSQKVLAYYGRCPVIPDAWVIRVEKVVAMEGKPINSKTNIMKTDFDYEVAINADGKPMENVGIMETLEFLIEEAKSHHEIQKEIVAVNTEIGDKLPFCDEHRKLCVTCGCEPKGSPPPSISEVSSITEPEGVVVSVERKKPWYSFFKPKWEPGISLDSMALQRLFLGGMTSEFITNSDLTKHSKFASLCEPEPKPTIGHVYSVFPRKKRRYHELLETVFTTVCNPASMFAKAAAMVAKEAIEDDLDRLTTTVSSLNWIAWIPSRWFSKPLMREALVRYHDNWMWRTVIWMPFLGIAFLPISIPNRLVLTGVSALMYRPFAKQVHSQLIWRHLQFSHTNACALVTRVREEHSAKVGKALAVLTIISGAVSLWHYMEFPVPWKRKKSEVKIRSDNGNAKPTTSHGTLIPTTPEEIKAKNDQAALMKVIATEHNWINVARKQFCASEKAWTTAREDLLSILKRGLLRMEWTDPITGNSSSVLILMVRSNRGITVGHFAPSTDTKVHFYRHEDRETSVSSNFSCWIGPKSIETFGEDCAVVYVPKGGVFRDIVDYFGDDDYTIPFAHLVWRSRVEQPRADKAGQLRDELICNAGGVVHAIGYNLPFAPQPGMCGAPLVSEGTPRCILGMHQAGDPDTSSLVGYATRVKRTELLQALDTLGKRWFEPLSDGVLRSSILGQKLIESPALHDKSPLRTIQHGHFEYIGQCPGRSTFRSTVHLQSTCRAVEEEFDITCEWRAPKMKDPWGVTINYMANSSDGIEPEHLLWAQEDYQTQVLRLIKEQPNLVSQVRPLTLFEAINGVDGVRFLDPMELKTAAGYGRFKKLELLIEVVGPDGKKTYHPTPILQEEVDYILKCFLSGRRCYSPFKLVFKDEAVNKDKMRAFSVGQFAFSLVTRMHLGYLHWLFKQSIEYSECAVGMNPHGPEWEEWMKWHTEYSDKLIFAGDYSKFDLTQSCMVKASSAMLFMKLGEGCGLECDSLQVIRGIYTELMYPVVACNGDLVQFFGYSPSGIPGTVEGNSSDNGHILRSAAHKILPVKTPKFRDVAKLGTYGDDVRGGVHPKQTWFNAPAVSRTLQDWNYKFTPPDKSDEFTSQWDPEGDFLKMTSGYVEGTSIRVGRLDPKSILKPLQAGTKSTLSKEAQAAVNIDGALRDSFAHGRIFYEDYRTKLRRVAQKTGVESWSSELSVDYDQAIVRWKDRYAVN